MCKKKLLMRADEFHKFCDGTLESVHNILRERLLNFKFGYNKGRPLREWTSKDKKRACIMVNKIDDLLCKRRILRSLEVLVGGRKTEMDKHCCKGHQNRRDLPRDIPLDSVEVLRYDTKGVKVHVRMEMEIPRSSRVKFITACSYSIEKYKDMLKAQVHLTQVFHYSDTQKDLP
ncbi:hypothetical protein Tco_1101963 [Tanacetum coccineum]